MAGIYIHIPFCKQACHYCDFHFSTSFGLKDDLLKALISEILLQTHFGENRKIETIYFGGGTPSVLMVEELNSIIQTIEENYDVNDAAEITLETNPDDLSLDYLTNLFNHSKINRLSIGIQSFSDIDLKQMNRAHDSNQAHEALANARKVGFSNISTDLIFGSQSTTNEIWKSNLKQMTQYDIPHISIYGLTVEPKTALAKFIQTGKLPQLDDQKFHDQFQYTQEYLMNSGYEQYEISNYCQSNHESKHNSAYWAKVDYLGIGPSSHSHYNGNRYWNIKQNAGYIKSIQEGKIPSQQETLSLKDIFNEYLMVGLRTTKGCSLEKLKSLDAKFNDPFQETLEKLKASGKIKQKNDAIIIPQVQRIFTDQITQELFFVD